MKIKDAELLNGLALAYMGDAIYELAIREYLIEAGYTKPNQLHHMATEYVSAKAQSKIIGKMLADDVMTETEVTYYKRGRNAKSHTRAQNVDSQTYSQSSGFESLMGYLHLTEQTNRLNELINYCIAFIDTEKGR